MTVPQSVLPSLLASFALAWSGVSLPADEPRPPAKPAYPPSPVIAAIDWDLKNLVRRAPGSDLWPVTWADDGDLYVSWGDGGGFGGTNRDGRVSLGFARLEGSPENLRAVNIWGGKGAPDRATFAGKSNGILCIDGALYAHVIENDRWWRAKIGRSADRGRTWTFREGAFRPDSWDFAEPDGAFSDLTFLNFGKNYEGARDGFVYVYSQDQRRDARGKIREVTDGVALMRVPKDRIMDRAAYEFFAGLDHSGKPRWTSEIQQRAAVFENPGSVGSSVRVDYDAGLRRYLLATFTRWDGSWGLYDAPEPWGPWTTAATFDQWIDPTPKFGFTIPQKWMSADGKTVWMVFSGLKEYDSFNTVKGKMRLR
jgi:Domain of unknown function (DUF4185)